MQLPGPPEIVTTKSFGNELIASINHGDFFVIVVEVVYPAGTIPADEPSQIAFAEDLAAAEFGNVNGSTSVDRLQSGELYVELFKHLDPQGSRRVARTRVVIAGQRAVTLSVGGPDHPTAVFEHLVASLQLHGDGTT